MVIICPSKIKGTYQNDGHNRWGGGEILTLTWYIHICACFLGCYFAKFGIVIGGFSSEMKEPKLHKLVYVE